MKTRILSLIALLLTCHTFVKADIDITDLYLQNAGFDDANYYDYKVSDYGNVSQEILSIHGWNKDIGVDYTVTGIYELGTAKTFNTNGKVPSTGYDGSKGGCLALSTGWDETLKYYQDVTLPAGSYKLQAAFYNGSNSANGASLMGWIPNNSNNSSHLSSVSSFNMNSWTLDEVTFTLSSATEGRVQIGFKGASGGSANSAKVVVDFVKIILVGNDNTLISNIRTELKNTLSSANSTYGNGEGKESDNLKAAIDKAQLVCDNTSASYADLFNENKAIQAALVSYELANATMEHPSDVTQLIINPSFEKGFDGWSYANLQTQTNTSFSQKSGNTYVEKWVATGSQVGDANVIQTISQNLIKGIYLLKVNAQNTQNGRNAQGAWIIAGTDSVEVSEAKEYTLQFIQMEDELTIGFVAHQASGNWIAADNFRLYYGAATTDDYKEELQKRIDVAQQLMQKNIGTSCQETLNLAIQQTENWISRPNMETLSSISRSLRNAIQEAQNSLAKAEFREKLENATGPVPSVTTDPRHARGATMAFGRATFSGNNIMEKGFCWSTHKDPTVLDNRTTLSYDNNGAIYVIDGLQPATQYYIRAYAITNGYAVGYGDCIRICTLPMGNITWTYNNGGSDEENKRINSAIEDAVNVWNHITSIQGLRLSVSYGASTQTADCSYGGSMRVGPNASYQRTGTIQHEMCHAAGVGTTETWYNSSIYRQETSKGFWLGERTDQVVQFLDNDNTAQLHGDNTHFWPYGINGAHEDDGTRILYYANALIIQALGEDNLPPVPGAFASPAYTFMQEDDEVYYLLTANESIRNMPTMLQTNASNGVSLKSLDWKEALSDKSFAWKITFNPQSQTYEMRNVQTNTTLNNNNANVTLSSNTNYKLQLLGSRQKVVNSYFNLKSYWMTFSDGSNRPMALTANQSNGNLSVSATRFDHQNSASQQRWIILSQKEVKALAGDFSEVQKAINAASLIVYGGTGEITCETFDEGKWINIHNLFGQVIDQFYMQAGMKINKSVKAGVYIVNGQKIIVKP
ncbi:MAG: DUF5013 domain-containing protein [Paludibacteraceae bacterium]|nr:DUF5013 domain-containing protein [Paludibacteraceae bacterium]